MTLPFKMTKFDAYLHMWTPVVLGFFVRGAFAYWLLLASPDSWGLPRLGYWQSALMVFLFRGAFLPRNKDLTQWLAEYTVCSYRTKENE